MKWLGAELKFAEPPALKIQIKLADEESAATIEDSINAGLKLVQAMPATEAVIPKAEHPFIFGALVPNRDGTRVSTSSGELTEDMDRLGRVLGNLLSQTRNPDKPKY